MIIHLEQKLVGAVSKAEGQNYVGGKDEFARLEADFGLIPFNSKKTHKLYRVAALEEAMKKAEEAERIQRYQRKS